MPGHWAQDTAAGRIAQRERRRAELVAEWVRITGKRQEVSAQVAPKPQVGRPEGGKSEAARKLGMTRQTVERSFKINGLSDKAKAEAERLGLSGNARLCGVSLCFGVSCSMLPIDDVKMGFSYHGGVPMFWKKKPPAAKQEPVRPKPPAASKPKTAAEKLNEAASSLASSLNAYSEAAYRAAQPGPDAELQAAYDKVGAARELVTKGRLAFALGRCLPEHVKYWPSWIKQDGFDRNVGFAATDIAATETKEEDGSREIKVKTIDFTFNGGRYRLILRDKGMSYAPGDPYRLGEVELFTGIERVAKFEIEEDLSKEYSEWEFSDVRALKVGPWMQDVLDMAAQIQASFRQRMDEFQHDRAREAAREIDLG